MSLLNEQRRSLIQSRNLLRDLMHHSTRPKTVRELRDRASRALKHFPALRNDGEPIWSRQ